MQRKVLQTLFLATFKGTWKMNRAVPCSCFHTLNTRYNAQPPWVPSSAPEINRDFSEHDSDEFGTLSPPDPYEKIEKMPTEKDERIEFDLVNEEGRKQRRPMRVYYKIIEKLLAQKKVADALDILETRMLKKDRVIPDVHAYNLLIHGCAKVGYCEKAFKLYKNMKERNITATAATYTGLINACAMSPFPEDAMKRVNHLRKKLLDDGWEFNEINYHCLIKAYARLGDIESAFSVVDEMLSKGFTLRNPTYGFLLQASISDKECGLRHALLVWHTMRKKKVTPDLWNYNLLIRCIRDCGIGDEEELQNLIAKLTGGEKSSQLQVLGEKEEPVYQQIESGEKPVVDEKGDGDKNSLTPDFMFQELETVENRPNLLARKPHLGSIISVNHVKTPTDRLLLLGGYKTLLKQMEEDNVKPDIRTFTQLLSIMPSTSDSEKFLLNEMKKYKVDLDIDFCNMLIKQRAYRMAYDEAKEVLSIIQENYLQPDIITFGVLALSCRNKWEANELINSMEEFSYRLNPEILGAMLKQACYYLNLDYVEFIMRLTIKLGIQPNEKYMEHLAELQRNIIEIRRKMKKNDTSSLPRRARHPSFRENSLRFNDYYQQWKKEITVFKPPHPYKQFRKPKTQDGSFVDKNGEEVNQNEHNTDDRGEQFKPYRKFNNRMGSKSEYPAEEYAASDSEVERISWNRKKMNESNSGKEFKPRSQYERKQFKKRSSETEYGNFVDESGRSENRYKYDRHSRPFPKSETRMRTESDYPEEEYGASDSEVQRISWKEKRSHKNDSRKEFELGFRDEPFSGSPSYDDSPERLIEREEHEHGDSVPEYEKYSADMEAENVENSDSSNKRRSGRRSRRKCVSTEKECKDKDERGYEVSSTESSIISTSNS